MENLTIINKRIYLRLLISGVLMALAGIFLKYGNVPEFFNRSFSIFFFTGSILMLIPGFIFLIIKPKSIADEENENVQVYVLRTRNAFIFTAIMVVTSVLTYSTSTDMSYFFLLLAGMALLVANGFHFIALRIYKELSANGQ
jgi:hypothetical protein